MCGHGDLGNREVEHNMMRVCVCVTGRGGGQHFQTVKSIVLHLQTCNVCFQNKSRSALHSSSYFRHTIGKKLFSPMSQMVLSADDDDVRHIEPSSSFTRGFQPVHSR